MKRSCDWLTMNYCQTVLEFLTTKAQNYTKSGWPQSRRKKLCEFSRLFQSHELTFPEVIATKTKCNNDLHQGSFLMNSSNITGHHCTLTKYLNDALKYFICYNFSLKLHRIPLVFHVQRNPWFSRFVATLKIIQTSGVFSPARNADITRDVSPHVLTGTQLSSESAQHDRPIT